MQAWRVAAASAIGTSHVASGAKCQDANGVGVFDVAGEHILILVVSDGAGSAKHSDIGAQWAVSTVQHEVETYFDQSGKCRFRLVSNKDPLFNYREYGLENGQG